jgi:hypothetical protein
MVKMMKNKKGWIKVVESVVAVLLIAGVLIIAASKGTFNREESSQKIYSVQVAILKEIQQNDSMRAAITGAAPVPVEWEDFEDRGLGAVRNKVTSRTPDYLICKAKVCDPTDLCDFSGAVDSDIYAYSIIIMTPPARQIKLFCWT